jgi:hypothetical protein
MIVPNNMSISKFEGCDDSKPKGKIQKVVIMVIMTSKEASSMPKKIFIKRTIEQVFKAMKENGFLKRDSKIGQRPHRL